VVNFNLKAVAGAMPPLSNELCISVTVCDTTSELVQVTVVPTLMVIEEGEKAKFFISTIFPFCVGGISFGDTAGFDEQPLKSAKLVKMTNDKKTNFLLIVLIVIYYYNEYNKKVTLAVIYF
jgi:hypothetical protein